MTENCDYLPSYGKLLGAYLDEFLEMIRFGAMSDQFRHSYGNKVSANGGLIIWSYVSAWRIFSHRIVCILMKCANTSLDYELKYDAMDPLEFLLILWNVSHFQDEILFCFAAHKRSCKSIIMWLIHAQHKHLLQPGLTMIIILEWRVCYIQLALLATCGPFY